MISQPLIETCRDDKILGAAILQPGKKSIYKEGVFLSEP
jgi:hypothetical protein